MPAPRKIQQGRDDMAENPLMVILGDKSSKEEKQEEVKEQRKNFADTQKVIVDNIGKRIKKMTRSIVKAITGKSSFLSKAIKFLFALIPSIFLSASEGLRKILDFGEKGFSKLSGFFSDTIPKIIARVENFIDIAKTRFLKILGAVKPAIVKRFSAIFSALRETKVGKFIAGFLDKLRPAFAFFTNIIEKFKPILNIFSGFFSKAGKFATFAGSVFGRVSSIFSTLSKFLTPVFKVISRVATFFKAIPLLGQIITAVEGIIGFFRGFLGTEGSLMDKLIGGIKGFFAQIISGFTFGIVSFEDVMGYIDGFINGITGFFSNVISFFTETLPNTFTGSTDAIGGFFSSVGSFFTETIPNFFKTLYKQFVHLHTVTIPEFFTRTIPDFFMNFSTRIGEYLDIAGSFLYDIFVQPWIDLGSYISDMFGKAKNYILDGLIGLVNTFNYGGVLDRRLKLFRDSKHKQRFQRELHRLVVLILLQFKRK